MLRTSSAVHAAHEGLSAAEARTLDWNLSQNAMVATGAAGEASLRASNSCACGRALASSFHTRERALGLYVRTPARRAAPRALLLVLGACAALLLGAGRARAEFPLAVEPQMRGVPLGRHM